jgi:hypothetical protein
VAGEDDAAKALGAIFSQTNPGPMLWSQFSAIFANFKRKIWRFSQKTMYLVITFSAKLPFILVKNAKFFCKKFLKNHNICPWSPLNLTNASAIPFYFVPFRISSHITFVCTMVNSTKTDA